MTKSSNHYFPGGNTTDGFFSYYNEILQHNTLNKIYTIKGGPGVGKSTLMKEVGKKSEAKNLSISYYHCSSDPDSLDGVLIQEKGILFVDGTSPHIIDPKYPGVVYELINLADFLDENALKKDKESIIRKTDDITSTFNKAYRFLNATKPLYNELNEIYKRALNKNEYKKTLNTLSDAIISGKKGSGFKEKKLFLSAITPSGFINYIDKTIIEKNIYILNSKIGDLTHLFLNDFKDILKQKEFYIECFYCPTDPLGKLEHIVIPELETAIITSNRYHITETGNTVDTSCIYDNDIVKKENADYTANLIDEILNHSVDIIKCAKQGHDELEDYYKRAMDYNKLNKFTTKIINSVTR